MTIEEYTELFDALIAAPLSEFGFLAKGKSVYFKDDRITVVLMRVSGRTIPGIAEYILCFRHNILGFHMNEEEKINKFSSYFNNYPYKYDPFSITTSRKISLQKNLNYTTRNLRAPIGEIIYNPAIKEKVAKELTSVCQFIRDHFFPFCKSITYKEVVEQIKKYGENAWIEQQWLKDYEEATN